MADVQARHGETIGRALFRELANNLIRNVCRADGEPRPPETQGAGTIAAANLQDALDSVIPEPFDVAIKPRRVAENPPLT